MLTNDLVRATQKGDVLTPRKVSLRSKLQLERAESIVRLFRDHGAASGDPGTSPR